MIKKLKNSPFFRSIFQLAFGSILAQLVVVVISPFITRVYTVDEMGLYALLLTITSIFGSVINGKYDSAIVSTNKEKDVPRLILVSLLFSFVFILLIMVGLYFFFVFKESELLNQKIILLFVGILLFMTGVTNILISYNNRKKEYGLISKIYVVRTSSQNLILLLFGLLNFGIIGMVFSQIVGIFFGIRKQYYSLKNDNLKYELDSKVLLETAVAYKEFPKYSLPANITNNLSYSSLNFFITYLYGLTTLGFYSLTFRILGLPLSLVSANVSKIFFRDASEEMKNKGNFKNALKKSSLFLLSIAIPMVIVLVVFSPTLFQFVFGKDWYVAGEYARILAPMFGVRLIVSAITPGFIVANKQNIEFYFQILFLVSSILSFLLSLIFNLEIISFLKIYSMINTVVYLVLFVKIYLLGKGE